MRGLQVLIAVVVLGAAGIAPAEFRDFNGNLVDEQWSTLGNWTTSGLPAPALPTTSDTVRIGESAVVRVANGVAAEAGATKIGSWGVSNTDYLYVESGGTLSGGIVYVGASRSDSFLDVSGTISLVGSSYINMGGYTGFTLNSTVNINEGASVTCAGIVLGSVANAATYTVNQYGGTVNLGLGEVKIADSDDSTCSATYTISGGILNASRLNTGGTGTSTSKFEVVGSDAEITFANQSWLGGETEIKFTLDAGGASPLMMTNGAYSASSTVSLTVDASAFAWAGDDGILLIGVGSEDILDQFDITSVTEGFALDYRDGDGLYLTGGSSEPANPATLFVESGADTVTVTATGLTASATYTLKGFESLLETNWSSIAMVSGVSETNWVLSATNAAMFYRVDSE